MGPCLFSKLHVVVVFTLNRPFYPASSVHPVSVLIPNPREILIMWSQTAVRQRKTKNKIKSQIQVPSEWSVSVPGTRSQQHTQDRKNKSKKTLKPKNKSEIKKNKKIIQTTQGLQKGCYLIDGKHTDSGRASICWTDEATRNRGRYRQKSVRTSRTDT